MTEKQRHHRRKTSRACLGVPRQIRRWSSDAVAIGALIFGFALWLGCLATASIAVAQSRRVVNFYGWADYISPEVLTAFTRETGITVHYDTFDTNDILEAKLLLGRSGYDVVVPTAYFIERLIKADVLQKLDKTKLPNLANGWPEIAERLAAYDPGNVYAVNYMWGTTGIAYNVAQAERLLGPGARIDSWDVVFRPEVIAKFRQCGVDMIDSADDILPAALSYLGLDPNTEDVATLERAADLIAAIRPSIRRFNSSEYPNALASGEVCLAVGWSGDIKQVQKAALDAKRGAQIGYSIPDGRAQMWLDNLAIPKQAPHLEEAYAFIDFMQRPEMAAKNTNFTRNANSNLASQKFIDPAILGDPTVYPPSVVMKNLYTVKARPQPMQRLVQRMWLRLKSDR
jgi:putrescine transport system substrate-binding protein